MQRGGASTASHEGDIGFMTSHPHDTSAPGAIAPYLAHARTLSERDAIGADDQRPRHPQQDISRRESEDDDGNANQADQHARPVGGQPTREGQGKEDDPRHRETDGDQQW